MGSGQSPNLPLEDEKSSLRKEVFVFVFPAGEKIDNNTLDNEGGFMKGFLPLPKEHYVTAIFNGKSKMTGKKALITKVSEISVGNPNEAIVKAKLEGTGKLVQSRILGFKNCQEIVSALNSGGYIFLL